MEAKKKVYICPEDCFSFLGEDGCRNQNIDDLAIYEKEGNFPLCPWYQKIMEAKDTVMDINTWLGRNGIDRAYKKDMKSTYEKLKGDFEAQAEISFKAGIKEVVEFLRENCFVENTKQTGAWQTRLKEWDL
jgi:hypothetical protein